MGAADRTRAIVVSHPYTAANQPASDYRVLHIDGAGAITDAADTFTMGRALGGEIAFTPDGRIGLVAQQDGTLGVFELPDGGPARVVYAAFEGSFYASRVVVDPSGDRAYVIDSNTRPNGGGIYRLAIACDGTLSDLGIWLHAKLPGGLHVLGDRAVLVAGDLGPSLNGLPSTDAGDDALLLDWTRDPPRALEGGDAFGDDDAIVGGTAVTADHQYVLIGDRSGSGSVPNRIAVASLDVELDTLEPMGVVSPLEDPLAILASPFGDVALAVSGLGDAVFMIDTRPTANPLFGTLGEVTYVGASPQLPSGAVMIERGPLRGLALIAENQGIRPIQMMGDAVVTDRGMHSLGAGTQVITGAIGVQP